MNAHAQALGVHTTCPYCGVGCGVVATPDGAAGVVITGDKSHPANFGRLCCKGSALGETLGAETRLLHPMVDGARATWEDALDRIAGGLRPRPCSRPLPPDHARPNRRATTILQEAFFARH